MGSGFGGQRKEYPKFTEHELAAQSVTPNPSLKRSANGASPRPRASQVIVSPRGRGATPLSPA